MVGFRTYIRHVLERIREHCGRATLSWRLSGAERRTSGVRLPVQGQQLVQSW
jgi:hypothetical protein